MFAWLLFQDGARNCKKANCEGNKLTPVEQKEVTIIEDSCQKIGMQWLIPYPCKRGSSTLLNKRLEKKLEAAEHQLAMNPEHTEAYDKQMIKLKEMNFARKLTKEDMTAYKGPTHYISHHEVLTPEKKTTPIRIVFNSSTSFQGHLSNDYWIKGHDLLNSLFGVIQRRITKIVFIYPEEGYEN